MLPFVSVIVTLLYCIYLMHSLHHTLMDCCKYLMIQNYLWQMVRMRATDDVVLDIPEGSTERRCGRGQVLRGNAPPPLVIHEQLLMMENELMRILMENKARREAGCPQHPKQQDMDSSYSDFLVTHPPLFSKAVDLLEADNWLRTTKSKFGLLHCMEY
jgi:hypothetical protein